MFRSPGTDTSGPPGSRRQEGEETLERKPPEPLLGEIDALEIPLPDREARFAFYRDRLGHQLIWRTPTAAGLRMPHTGTEIVLQTQREGMDVALLVEPADAATRAIILAGAKVLVPSADVRVGRCVMVEDPWRNRLVLPDMRNGPLVTDADRNVLGSAEAKADGAQGI